MRYYANLKCGNDPLIAWLVHRSQVFGEPVNLDSITRGDNVHMGRRVVPEQVNGAAPMPLLNFWGENGIEPVLRGFGIHPSTFLRCVRDWRFLVWTILEADGIRSFADEHQR